MVAVLFCIAALLVLSVVFLLIALVAPQVVSKLLPWFSRESAQRGKAVGLAVALVVVLAVAEGVLLALPRVSVEVASSPPVVAGESEFVTLAVKNTGLMGTGGVLLPVTLDAVRISDVGFALGGRGEQTVRVPITKELEPGSHTLVVGDESLVFKALKPAEFQVKELKAKGDYATVGERLTVSATVANVGEVAGTFNGVLRDGGKEAAAEPVEVAAGAQKPLELTYTGRSQGKHRLKLGDATVDQVVVKPIRFKNGHCIKKPSGGPGVLSIANKGSSDLVAMLVPKGKKAKRSVAAIYVRAGQKTTVKGIPNGAFTIYYEKGEQWNTYMHAFLVSNEAGRFAQSANYTTSSSTSSWSDSRYRYTRTSTRFVRVTLSFGVTGGNAPTESVSPSALPKP